MSIRPLFMQRDHQKTKSYVLDTEDGFKVGLQRVMSVNATNDSRNGPAVMILHGMTASSDMFVLPETRNFVDVLLDAGFDPWLLDWRGSCRLKYNEEGVNYSLDEAALYDVPLAVKTIRAEIDDKPLLVVAHCVGAMVMGLSLTAGLIRGLSGMVVQGVFLTPKVALRTALTIGFAREVLRPIIGNTLPIDFSKVGLWSKYTPVFALTSIGAECPDPTCQMLHNSAWGTGASLFVHDNLNKITHDRLGELLGDLPFGIVPHIRKAVLSGVLQKYHENNSRFDVLANNCLEAAGNIDCPLYLISGSQNDYWQQSNKFCFEALQSRFPKMDIEYTEIPGYGHLDAFIGRGACYDFFPPIINWLNKIVTRQGINI